MMLKFLTAGALCTIAALGAQAAPVPPHHGNKHGCHCPKGYESIKGECVTKEIVPKHSVCPYDKFPHYGDICLKPVAATPSCPPQFELVPKVGCVNAVKEEAVPVCPKGFFVEAEHCERVFNIPPTPTCPNQKEFIQDDQCVRVFERPAQTYCQGRERKGKCFLLQEGNNVLECPVNFKLVGDRCEKVEFAQKVYVCHWHYNNIFEKNAEDAHPSKKCQRTIDVACGHNQKGRHLAPVDVESEESGIDNVTPITHPVTYPHSHSKKACHKTVYYPARGRCPRGFTSLEGAEKYMNHHHYDKKQKPECVRVEVLAPEIICLDKLIHNKCRKVVQIPFNLRCKSSHGWRRVGNKCVKIRTTDTTPTCPPNTTEVIDPITGDLIACKKTRTLPAKKECNVGFEYKHGKCVQLTIVKPTLCPHYAIERHGQCFVKADPVFKCPKGFSPSPKDTKTCVALKKHKPICPHHKNSYPWVDNSFPHSGHW